MGARHVGRPSSRAPNKKKRQCAAASANLSYRMRNSPYAANGTEEDETQHAEPAAATMHGVCVSCGKSMLLPSTASACDAVKHEDSKSITTMRQIPWQDIEDTSVTPVISNPDGLLREALRRGPRLPTNSQELEELCELLLEGYSAGWLALRPPAK